MCLANYDNLWDVWTSAINFATSNEDTYYWNSNGEILGPHTNWAANEPKIDNNFCVALRYREGAFKWVSDSCLAGRVYMCKWNNN